MEYGELDIDMVRFAWDCPGKIIFKNLFLPKVDNFLFLFLLSFESFNFPFFSKLNSQLSNYSFSTSQRTLNSTY